MTYSYRAHIATEESNGFQACIQLNKRSEVTVENILKLASEFFIVDHVEECPVGRIGRRVALVFG